jgi:hypothetical protein
MNKRLLNKNIWILSILIFIPVIFAQEQCVDSDNGINYHIKGEAKGVYGKDNLTGIILGENPNQLSLNYNYSLNYSIFYDHCYDNETSRQLNEAYCDENNTLKSISYNCIYGCQDGACINETIIIEGNLKLVDNNIIIESIKEDYIVEGSLKSEILQHLGKRITSTGYDISSPEKFIIDIIDYEIYPLCNNQICEPGEDYQNCPEDCQLCIEEGEFALKEQICCSGLKWIDSCSVPDIKCQKNQIGYCTNCGNNICGQRENHYNCPSDCPTGIKDNICDAVDDGLCDPDCRPEEDPDCEIIEAPMIMFYIQSLLILIAFVLILISVLLLNYFRSQKIKAESEKKKSKKRQKQAKKINDFFESAVKKGYTKKKIKNMLLNQAWPEKIVNEYCDKFFSK